MPCGVRNSITAYAPRVNYLTTNYLFASLKKMQINTFLSGIIFVIKN